MKCIKCGLPNKHNDRDLCLGMLRGVANACCGHGELRVAYIQFMDGAVIRGQDAITIQKILKSDRVETSNCKHFLDYKIGDFKINRRNKNVEN